MKTIPTPTKLFFNTKEDNDTFVASLNETLQLLMKIATALEEACARQFNGERVVPITAKGAGRLFRQHGIHFDNLPRSFNSVQWLHDTKHAISGISAILQFYDVYKTDGIHILSTYGFADNFIWQHNTDLDGTNCFKWFHKDLVTINLYLPCSINVSTDILPPETIEFIKYLIKGEDYMTDNLKIGFFKGDKRYTEEDYIEFYNSSFPESIDKDLEEMLRRRYRNRRALQRQEWRRGNGVCDYVGYELEKAPISGFVNMGWCAYGFIPKTQTLVGLEIDVKISDVPIGFERDALSMVLKLLKFYGSIHGSYSDIKREFELLKSDIHNQFFKSDFE